MALSQNYTTVVQVKVSDVQLKSQLNNIKVKPLTLKVRVDSKDAKAQLDELGNSAKEAAIPIDNLGKGAEKSGKQVKSLGADFSETLGKVAKFAAVTAVIGAFTGVVSEAISTTKEFDDALTDFKKVSDLSGDSLDAYTEKLGGLGEAIARTRTEMVQASTEFKKSGYSDEESAQLAQIASLYQNVADSELSAGDASSFVISQMKAFNITADEAITIIDRVNEVSNSFSVSSTDISSALTKTSASLATYGNTMDETIGLTNY